MPPKTTRKKKTEIPISEPRHRVGPKGVSSGISFRELPPASLDQIKKVCEHYQQKCAGTYKSLASRYVYQMATEIEGLVEILKEEASSSSSSSSGSLLPIEEMERELRQKEKHRSSKQSKHNNRTSSKKNDGYLAEEEDHKERRHSYPSWEQGHASCHQCNSNNGTSRERIEECQCDRDGGTFRSSNAPRRRSCCSSNERSSCRHNQHKHNHHIHNQSHPQNRHNHHYSSMAQQNLEDQNEEIFRWLKEEMERSHSLLLRSKRIHDAELDDAQRELAKVKKAAKMIIKAVYRRGKDKAEKSEKYAVRAEAHAERERRRRVTSQRMIESLIDSHSEQIEILRRGLRGGGRSSDSRHSHDAGDSVLTNDARELCGLMDDSDLTSVLDSLAEEAYQQSCCSMNNQY